MKIDTEYKNKRVQFRESYDKLDSGIDKKAFIHKLGKEFYTILDSGYLFLDQRDGKLYDCMFVDNTRWMAQNFSYNRNNKSDKFKYKWNELTAIIPKGWRLPTFNDYLNLILKAEAIVAKEQGIEKLELDFEKYEVYEMLQEDKILEFNAGLAVYGYPENYIPFWTADKEFFHVWDGQNEFAYGFETFPKKDNEEAYVRFVQDESTL